MIFLPFKVAYSSYKKVNKQVYKGKFVILQSIGIVVIKNKKQGWSPTPAGILGII